MNEKFVINRQPIQKNSGSTLKDKLKTKTGIQPLLRTSKDEKSIRYDDKDKAEIL